MKQCTTKEAPAGPSAACPKCGGRLETVFLHVGGHGSCPHRLCPSCGYQRRLMPAPVNADRA